MKFRDVLYKPFFPRSGLVEKFLRPEFLTSVNGLKIAALSGGIFCRKVEKIL